MTIYTAEFKEEIVEEFNKGKTLEELMIAYNVPIATLSGWIVRSEAGLDLNDSSAQQRGVREFKSLAINDYRSGRSREEICSKYKLKYSTVYNWTKNRRVDYSKLRHDIPKQQWVSAEEMVPDHTDSVLVVRIVKTEQTPLFKASTHSYVCMAHHQWKKHDCNCGSCGEKKSVWVDYILEEPITVTHWMELPELPHTSI